MHAFGATNNCSVKFIYDALRLLIFALGIANIIAKATNQSKRSISSHMQEINETGNVHDRIDQMVDRFCGGNKTAFGRGANIQSGVLAGLIGGRKNKPSFEVLQKILTGYPDVSPDWLLFGHGEMIRSGVSVPPFFSATIREEPKRNPILTSEGFEQDYISLAIEWARISRGIAQWERDHEILHVLAQYVAQQDNADEFVAQVQRLLPAAFTPRVEEEIELAKQLRELRQRASK